MNSKDLQDRWLQIGVARSEHSLRLLRISAECVPELSLGLSPSQRRCLVLSLESIENLNIPATEREYLSLYLLQEEEIQYVVIELIDIYFEDLFNDLIASIYNRIDKIKVLVEQAQELIRCFHRWSEFFTKVNSSRLSRQQIEGLLGELQMLQECITKNTDINIDHLLNAWRGPYDNSTDFLFDSKNVEVKTILSGKNSVVISSEFQLAIEPAKDLELVVYEVEQNTQDGFSISEQLKSLKEVIYTRLGDFTIILKALAKMSLTMGNVTEYDNFRFSFQTKRTYKAADEEFPKLNNENTKAAIHSLKYSIRLGLLENYLIEELKYDSK